MPEDRDDLLADAALLRLLFTCSPDAILLVEPWHVDAGGQIIACSDAACRMYGYGRDELIGYSLALLQADPGDPAASDVFGQVQREGTLRIETIHRRKDGTRLPLELSLAHVPHDRRDLVIATVRDITLQRRTEQRLATQLAVTRLLAEAGHFMEAVPRMLQIIAECLDWELGAMWCVDHDAGVLSWTIGWYAGTVDATAYEAASRQITFPPGAGLLGEVWASQEARWVADMGTAGNVAPHVVAAKAGLRSGFAFPIAGKIGVFGVMEFYSRETRPPDAELLAMAAAIGSQCGTYIERRRAEDARRFQARMLDTVDQAVIATDLNGRITYWNHFAEQLYGWEAAEAIGCNIMDIILSPGLQAEAMAIMERLSAGESWTGELLVRRRDGSTFPAMITDSPVYDNQGRLVGIVGVSVDITEAKRAEERLQFLAEASALLASSLDYETTLANLGRLAVPRIADWCSINLIDETGAMVRVAGRHVDPVKEAALNDLRLRFPPGGAAFQSTMAGARSDGPILVSEVTDAVLVGFAQTAEQLRVYREMGFRSAILVPLQVGERLLGLIILATAESGRSYGRDDAALAEDLAGRAALAIENARLYQDAQAAIRVRDEFLSVAAHELKTPVTALVGYSQVLQRRMVREQTGSDRDRRAVQVIGEQAERLGKLIGSLLEVSRLETGQFVLAREAMDLSALVRRVVDEVQSTLDRHTLTYFCPDTPVIVEGDALRLEQMLHNLLQNAVKYSPDGGPIMVCLEPRADEVAISVADRGVGIPPEEQPHLFQRFYRATNVPDLSITGMGIGLYVVKEIVRRHGGAVDIASVLGQGSTFTVRLPLPEPLPAAAP